MSSNKNFNYLGETFQLQLINQIVADKDFARAIIEVTDVNYFENKYFKLIIRMIKEYYEKFETSPSFETLRQISKSEFNQEITLKVILDTIDKISEVPYDGCVYVQEKSLKFCKQQEMQKVMTKAQKIIDDGEFESYDAVEAMVTKALQVGEIDKGSDNVFNDMDDVLNEDYRHPIPTGIEGIDHLLKGGLAKGEVGVILAPTGVGKSTVLTKLANHAYNMGFNVVQIYFEDNPKIIKRKHFTLWTGIRPDDLSDKKDEVIEKVNNIKNSMSNKLIMKKYPSDTVSMSVIKNYIRKLIADGDTIDMVLVDYIDCIKPEQMLESEWKSEGTVIRAFEAMCHEFQLVGWTAVQGGRCVSLDTKVTIENQGVIEIKNVNIGDKILTNEGFKFISNVFPIEKQPVYEITTKSGKKIKVSKKHIFPIVGGVEKSINTGLKVGDKLFSKK